VVGAKEVDADHQWEEVEDLAEAQEVLGVQVDRWGDQDTGDQGRDTEEHQVGVGLLKRIIEDHQEGEGRFQDQKVDSDRQGPGQ